jgi:Tol biopolymer transport system component/DNA-binding winged helix-turn-helix (wHTH) protein
MGQPAQHLYEFGSFRLDVGKRLLMRDGEVVQLTPKCFDILLALVENSAEVLCKDKLIARVWPDSFVEEGNLTYNISILRKVLGERAGEHHYIATIPGQGYQFVANVKDLMNQRADLLAAEHSPTSLRDTSRGSEGGLLREEAGARSPKESFLSSIVHHKRRLMIVAVVMVIAAAGISFGLYKLINGNQSRRNLAEPFQKMKIIRLTTTGKATVAAISPDGKYVVHAMGTRSQQSLWLRHIATGSDKEIVPTDRVNYSTLTFSPDGNYICFLRWESVGGWNPLYRVPVLGELIQKLGSDVDAGPTFSPDGRQIAYVRGYPERDEALLITANADGTEEKTLLSKRPQWNVFPSPGRAWAAWGPAWSPDGEVIAFALRKDEPDGKYWNVMTVRVEDHAEQQITFQKWASLGQLSWLSDGNGLIVTAADNESYPAEQVFHVSYPSGHVDRITNDTSDYSGVRLTADSTALVTVRTEQTSNLWVASGDSNRAAQITSNNFGRGDEISWVPDGRILYASRSRGSSDIWIMNADGTGQKQLTADARDNFHPSVSADGRYIVFASTRTGNRCVWRMDIDGSNPKQLTFGIDARGTEITPDGEWVVYWDVGSGARTLWKVSIDGANQVQLTDYYSRSPVVSPDGKQIALVFLDESVTPKRWRVAVIPFAGGPPAKVFDFPQPPGQTVRWTSDGRALTYLDTRNGVYNIWAQPLDGSPPKKLTNFTTDQIFAYAWSRDGKRLACVRGNQNSDVVLINAIR